MLEWKQRTNNERLQKKRARVKNQKKTRKDERGGKMHSQAHSFMNGAGIPSDSPALLDKDSAIKVMGGDIHIYNSIWEMFVQYLPARLTTLRWHLEQGEEELQKRSVHKLKGHFKTVGAVSCHALCLEIENSVKQGQLHSALHYMQLLDQEAQKLLEM